MFQTERVPVKVYRWDDPGAPKLTTDSGAFKTVLKACLVTGYGEGDTRKEPLGWEIHQEIETAAYFRSVDKKSTGAYLLVNGASYSYYGYVLAKFKISSEIEPHVDNQTMQPEVSNSINELHCQLRRDWTLIGNGRAFWLIVGSEYERDFTDGSKRTPSATALFFGDFPSIAPHDLSSTALMSAKNGNYSLENDFGSTLVFRGSVDNKTPAKGGLRALLSFNYSQGGVVESIAGRLIASPFYFFQSGNLRGQIPGLLGSLTAWYSDVNCFEKYRLDNHADEFLIFTTGYAGEKSGIGRNFLINLTAWDM